VGEAKFAFELNSDLLTILELEPEEAKDDVQIPDHKAERTFPISQVAAVIAAGKFFKTPLDQIIMTLKFLACLAHFIIVVGGLTGDKGYTKFLAVQLCARNLWQ
jgi:hypothetical protein